MGPAHNVVVSYLCIVFCSQLDDAGINDRVHRGREMGSLLWVICSLKPLHDVEIVITVQGNRILIEQIRHQHEVAIGSELVGDQLSVDKTVTNDIGYAVVLR